MHSNSKWAINLLYVVQNNLFLRKEFIFNKIYKNKGEDYLKRNYIKFVSWLNSKNRYNSNIKKVYKN